MLKAKLEKYANDKYSKHLYIYDTIKEGTERDHPLETPVEASTIITDDPEKTFIVDTNHNDAYIIREDGYEIYAGYTSKEVLRHFKLL